MKNRRRKLKRWVKVSILMMMFLILIFIVYSLCFSSKRKIIGTWTTDNITTYEFYKDGTGKLITSLSEYKFNYNFKKNILYIDFENDKSEDSEYKYKIEKNKLVLNNENGIFYFKKIKIWDNITNDGGMIYA